MCPKPNGIDKRNPSKIRATQILQHDQYDSSKQEFMERLQWLTIAIGWGNNG